MKDVHVYDRKLMFQANLTWCANVSAERKSGAPGAIPTRDLPLRRRTLYATELREQIESNSEPETVNSRIFHSRFPVFGSRFIGSKTDI